VPTAIVTAVRHGRAVLAVGSDKQLTAQLPGEIESWWTSGWCGRSPSWTTAPYGLIDDPQSGYLGSFQPCGRWHLDRVRVVIRDCPRHGRPVVDR